MARHRWWRISPVRGGWLGHATLVALIGIVSVIVSVSTARAAPPSKLDSWCTEDGALVLAVTARVYLACATDGCWLAMPQSVRKSRATHTSRRTEAAGRHCGDLSEPGTWVLQDDLSNRQRHPLARTVEGPHEAAFLLAQTAQSVPEQHPPNDLEETEPTAPRVGFPVAGPGGAMAGLATGATSVASGIILEPAATVLQAVAAAVHQRSATDAVQALLEQAAAAPWHTYANLVAAAMTDARSAVRQKAIELLDVWLTHQDIPPWPKVIAAIWLAGHDDAATVRQTALWVVERQCVTRTPTERRLAAATCAGTIAAFMHDPVADVGWHARDLMMRWDPEVALKDAPVDYKLEVLGALAVRLQERATPYARRALQILSIDPDDHVRRQAVALMLQVTP